MRGKRQKLPSWLLRPCDGVDPEFDADQEQWTLDLIGRVQKGNALEMIPHWDGWGGWGKQSAVPAVPAIPVYQTSPSPVIYDRKRIEWLAGQVARIGRLSNEQQCLEIAKNLGAVAEKYQWGRLDAFYVEEFARSWLMNHAAAEAQAGVV